MEVDGEVVDRDVDAVARSAVDAPCRAAEAALDQAIARYPDQWALRDARAEHRLGERHYEAALLDLRAVASGSDEAWRAARARDRIADLDARSDGFVAIGPSLRDRPGPAGLSRFTNTEIPLELRWPLGVDRALFATVDVVIHSAAAVSFDSRQRCG